MLANKLTHRQDDSHFSFCPAPSLGVPLCLQKGHLTLKHLVLLATTGDAEGVNFPDGNSSTIIILP